MSDDIRDRMRRGEAATAAGLDIEAPVGAVVHRVRRKRAVRSTMKVALGVVAVGSAAVGVQAVADGWNSAPAATVGPDTTAPLPPEPGVSQGATDPGIPSMVPVDAELVSQYLKPTEGPALVTGAMPATSEYGDAASACGEDRTACDHPSVPALTSAVLAGADERWAVALYSQAPTGAGPDSALSMGGQGPAGLYLVGPEGKAAFVAAGDPDVGPIVTTSTAGVAWAPGRESAVIGGPVTQGGDPGAGGFTLIDLLSGDTTTVFGECSAVQAVAQDEGWLLRALCPDGPVAAVVSDSGELVTLDGVLVAEGRLIADGGFAVNVGGGYLVSIHENDGAASAYYALTPAGDTKIEGDDCYPTDEGRAVVCTENGELAVFQLAQDRVLKLTEDPHLEGSPDLEICTVGDIEVRRIGQYDEDNVSQILVWPSGEQVKPDPVSNSQFLTCTSAAGGVGYFSGSGGVWSFDSSTLATRQVIAAPSETYAVQEGWTVEGVRVVGAQVVVGGPSFLRLG